MIRPPLGDRQLDDRAGRAEMQRLDPREKLETLIPKTPKFMPGKVVAHSNGITVG